MGPGRTSRAWYFHSPAATCTFVFCFLLSNIENTVFFIEDSEERAGILAKNVVIGIV